MELFRYSRSIYGGQDQLIGASWDLLPGSWAPPVAFIILHAILNALSQKRRGSS